MQWGIALSKIEKNLSPSQTNLELALGVFEALDAALDKITMPTQEWANIRINVCRNFSEVADEAEQWNLSIINCDKGIKLCRQYNQDRHLFLLMSNKGHALLALGETEAGVTMLKKVHQLLSALDQTKWLERLLSYTKNVYGIDLLA